MRRALEDVVNRPQEQSLPADFPAPTKGWSTWAALAATPPGYALSMKNFIPYPDKCQLRAGSDNWATGFTTGKEVQTLLSYRPSGSGAKLFAATDQGLYDVTSSGAIGAVSSSATNAFWQWVNFANSATNWLCCVNGVDDFRHYNGSAWTTVASFGSVATNTLIGIEVYQQRLFFVKKDSKELYYLPTGAVTGSAVATVIYNEQLMRRGGYIMAIGTWTLDSGTGLNDRLAVVTSEGEVIIYAGTDPSDPAAWSHEGTYFVGRPVGRRCLAKLGGDLLVLTERGLFPLSLAIQSTTMEVTSALSREIEPDITREAKAYFSTTGWQVEPYVRDQLLIVNVPQGTENVQYVMQLQTRGWCKFEGIDANCWTTFNGDLYYGTLEKVGKAQYGTSDRGSAIQGEIEYAYSRVDGTTRTKQPVLVMPLMAANGEVSYSLGVSADFARTTSFQTISTGITSTAAIWDTSSWDSSYYGGGQSVIRYWTTVPSPDGAMLAPIIRASSSTYEISWIGLQMLYKRGGLLS